MNDCQRGLQALTRRMMAAVSELALYQALSLKYKDDRELLAAEVEAARHNMADGRPPTAGADKVQKGLGAGWSMVEAVGAEQDACMWCQIVVLHWHVCKGQGRSPYCGILSCL